MSFHLYSLKSDTIKHQSITDMCVVLDLDATLIATQDSIDSLKQLEIMTNPRYIELRRRSYCLKLTDLDNQDGSRYDFWGITRPHIEEFLLFCFNYFKYVIVWSAGKRNYVHAIVKKLFQHLRAPHLILTYDDIVLDKDDNVEKPISKLLKCDLFINNQIKTNQIYVVDDNETTFVRNKKNAIYIPPFDPLTTIENMSEPDTALLQLKYWLLLPHVIHAEDITLLDKSTIFSYPHEDYKAIADSY